MRMSIAVLDNNVAGKKASIPFTVSAAVGFGGRGTDTHLAIGFQSAGTLMVANPGYFVGAFFHVQYAQPAISGIS